ncbi:MAG: hypothetical protein ACK2TU_03060 [Anaerolineales bacterium]
MLVKERTKRYYTELESLPDGLLLDDFNYPYNIINENTWPVFPPQEDHRKVPIRGDEYLPT